MLFASRKSGFRREQIRKERPDTVIRRWERLREGGVIASLQIAFVFFLICTAILMMRQDVVPYRPGQWTHHDILSRIDFVYMDQETLTRKQQDARQNTPHVFSQVPDAWKTVEEKLLSLPDRVAGVSTPDELPAELRKLLDLGSFTRLNEFRAEAQRPQYVKLVKEYVASLRKVAAVGATGGVRKEPRVTKADGTPSLLSAAPWATCRQ